MEEEEKKKTLGLAHWPLICLFQNGGPVVVVGEKTLYQETNSQQRVYIIYFSLPPRFFSLSGSYNLTHQN